MLVAERVGALDQLLLGDHVEHGECRRAGDRAAGIGAAEAARIRRVHDRGPADDARQREAAGERFGDGDEVGLDAGILDAEHLAGAREAGLHLVGDQQDAVLVADRAQRLEQFGRRRMEAALALHRLDDDRRDVDRIDVGAEEIFDGLQRVGDGDAVLRHRERHVPDAAGIGPNFFL